MNHLPAVSFSVRELVPVAAVPLSVDGFSLPCPMISPAVVDRSPTTTEYLPAFRVFTGSPFWVSCGFLPGWTNSASLFDEDAAPEPDEPFGVVEVSSDAELPVAEVAKEMPPVIPASEIS